MPKNIIKNALINAGGTAAYIVLISSFLFNIEKIFESSGPDDTVLEPIIMLLLLVISASVTGFLVFGKPAMWYFEGKRKEAVSLLFYTIGFLVLIAIVFISILF